MANAWARVDPRRTAHDLAEPAVQHLLLGAQEAFLVAPAVADPQIAAAGGGEDRVGAVERQRQRLLHQHGLAQRERRADGGDVLLLRGRYDHRGHARIGDRRIIVARMQVRAGGVGQLPGAGGIAVGDGEEAHRRMLGREPRPQRADPPGADHRDA
jgi:hypothetical protein